MISYRFAQNDGQYHCWTTCLLQEHSVSLHGAYPAITAHAVRPGKQPGISVRYYNKDPTF